MTDSFVQLPPDSTGKQVATNEISGKQFQVIQVSDLLGVPLSPLTDAELRASAVPVSISGQVDVSGSITDGAVSTGQMLLVGGQTAGGTAQVFETNASGHLNISDGGGSITVDAASLPLPTGAATEATLAAMNSKLSTAIVDMPSQNVSALPVRIAPQKYMDSSFSQVGSGLLSPEFTQIRAGSGMTISQSAGNLVIATGTTVNSESVFRSTQIFNGALTLKEVTTLSQRIVNNNFFIELVDLIGDGLAYNIVNTTTVDVTLTAHGYTAQNVGQRMDLCALSSVGVPMEGVIASIPDANTIRFTVAGYPASGSGTLSLTGWNKVEILYTGTTATNLSFNTRRRGWQNTAATATINTTAAAHMGLANVENGIVSLADKVITAGAVITNRSSWDTNIPLPETEMYIQIRAKNGTTAPASTTTWTIGMVRVEDYISSQVSLVSTRQQSISNSLPVAVISAPTTTVTGTVTATVTGGTTLPVTPTTTFTNSAASTNGTVIKGSAGTLWSVCVSNINAAIRYLKLYNSATVTVGTTTPILTIAIPAGGTVQFDGGSNGIRFATGICLGITTGAADNDTGAVAANEIKVATTFT